MTSTPRILCPGCGQPIDPARSARDTAHVIECTARAAADGPGTPAAINPPAGSWWRS